MRSRRWPDHRPDDRAAHRGGSHVRDAEPEPLVVPDVDGRRRDEERGYAVSIGQIHPGPDEAIAVALTAMRCGHPDVIEIPVWSGGTMGIDPAPECVEPGVVELVHRAQGIARRVGDGGELQLRTGWHPERSGDPGFGRPQPTQCGGRTVIGDELAFESLVGLARRIRERGCRIVAQGAGEGPGDDRDLIDRGSPRVDHRVGASHRSNQASIRVIRSIRRSGRPVTAKVWNSSG